MRLRSTAAAIIALAAGATAAHADTYNDLASFLADTQSLTLVNFDVDASGVPFNAGDQIGNRYGAWGVQFSPGNYSTTGSGPVSSPNIWVNDTFIGGGPRFDADFTAGDVTAVGMHHPLFAGGGTTTLSAFDSSGNLLGTVNGDSDINSLDFFGLTTTSPIARIEIQFVNQFGWGLDDLYFGQVPAPGAASVLGIGLLLAARRRR